MIINSANKFVDNVTWWISFFTVIFWVLACIPVAMFVLMLMFNGPPRRGDEALFLLIGGIVYIGGAFLLHRLTMIGFEFMKAIVATAVECQQELKKIQEDLNKDPKSLQTGPPNYDPPTTPSPYNF